MDAKTLLIADDEENLRLLVRCTLDEPSYRILEAVDGKEALRIARAERPDLILLDWMMPGLSGFEVLKALKQDPATAGLQVAMLTAKAQIEERERCLALGACDYIVKPFSPLGLMEVVRERLPDRPVLTGGVP